MQGILGFENKGVYKGISFFSTPDDQTTFVNLNSDEWALVRKFVDWLRAFPNQSESSLKLAIINPLIRKKDYIKRADQTAGHPLTIDFQNISVKEVLETIMTAGY